MLCFPLYLIWLTGIIVKNNYLLQGNYDDTELAKIETLIYQNNIFSQCLSK